MGSTVQDFDARRIVGIHAERVTNVSDRNFPGYVPGEEATSGWDLGRFRDSLTVRITRLSNRTVEFDLVGVDASIANAFRRIMIGEVPTICIERVYVYQNTSIMQDEVLAQRLGCVPLNVHPSLLEWKHGEKDPATDQNTILFDVDITCTRKSKPSKGAKGKASASTGAEPASASQGPSPAHPLSSYPSAQLPPQHSPAHPLAYKPSKEEEDEYVNSELLSAHIVWKPTGSQGEMDEFRGVRPAALNPNIVLTKLRPGQHIKMSLHAQKGIGSDHAKFTPVATASYRLLPTIKILKSIPPNLADKFQGCFSKGVVKLDPKTKEVSIDPVGIRNDTVSREVLRHPEFEGSVELGRVRDWFLFSVESESAYTPEEIFPAAVNIMRDKIKAVKDAVEALRVDMGLAEAPSEGEDGMDTS